MKHVIMSLDQYWIPFWKECMLVPSTSEKSQLALKSRVQFEQSISELQLKLQESIEQENYEQAAQLRDQLKELEESTKTEV